MNTVDVAFFSVIFNGDYDQIKYDKKGVGKIFDDGGNEIPGFVSPSIIERNEKEGRLLKFDETDEFICYRINSKAKKEFNNIIHNEDTYQDRTILVKMSEIQLRNFIKEAGYVQKFDTDHVYIIDQNSEDSGKYRWKTHPTHWKYSVNSSARNSLDRVYSIAAEIWGRLTLSDREIILKRMNIALGK